MKNKIAFCLLGLALIASLIKFFPVQHIKTNELADNLQGCPYYITLQSIVANYQLLASDRVNAGFIKNRVLQFERDIALSKGPVDIVSSYKNSYYSVLTRLGVNTIQSVSGSKIIAIAKDSSSIIDRYYLDTRLFCVNQSLLGWGDSNSRRILMYALGGLYDQIPNRYMRILAAYPNDTQLGVYSGFFVNNQTTSLETQFVTGMPMLTALYVLPKHDYAVVGNYNGMVPWGYFQSGSFTDSLTRKVLDVAGIDVFSVLGSDMAAKKIKEFPGTVQIKHDLEPRFGGDYKVYLNTQSYGLAYLANNINYNPKHVHHYERVIKRYFSLPDKHDPAVFRGATDFFYQQLMELKDYRDIVLEAPQPHDIANEATQQAGTVTTKGIVGERALFDVNCLRDHCTFVLNISDAPGWHAFVNRHSAAINRANFAFMATSVPKGESTVWFIYAPFSTLFCYFLSIFTLIGLCAIASRRDTKIGERDYDRIS